MHRPQTTDPAYIFDASSLINLERQDKLRHLSELGHLVVIHERIAKEVSKNPRSDLAKWIVRHPDRINHAPLLADESTLHVRLRQQRTPKVHDPEAIALAIAWHRKGILVCDDNAALWKANHHSVTCLKVDQFVQKIEPRMFK